MTRILSRAFRAVALVGVTLALAACSAQTPERETGGATAVLGSEVQIGQPVTVVGVGGTQVVIPSQEVVISTQELVTPAQQMHKITKTTTESGEVVYIEAESGKVVYIAPQAGET